MTKPKSALAAFSCSVLSLALACGDPTIDDDSLDESELAVMDEELLADSEPESELDPEVQAEASEATEDEELAITELQSSLAVDRSYGFLPHNRERYLTAPNGCRLTVMHGNYLGAIYGKVDMRDCNCIGWATVTAAYANGTMVSNQGKTINCSSGWSQGTVPPGYGPGLVGTAVTVGNTITGKVDVLQFSGIP